MEHAAAEKVGFFIFQGACPQNNRSIFKHRRALRGEVRKRPQCCQIFRSQDAKIAKLEFCEKCFFKIAFVSLPQINAFLGVKSFYIYCNAIFFS